ncbi:MULTISPECIES: hypothetical protein [Enterobacter cloacae complex]|uniref:hypothetical protein n=1 Tax=Enterobacter cloacae complex TaxID=354276 RepID=UPI0007173D9F|nr:MULTISPECIES: hypothetical protein [Enterobacter cloacae complex]EKY1715522.1 hypothetical protein [Enterobacter hormaechei]ELH1595484.1 hypothetical protein [Enterobacter hormaechei]EMF0936116.1 hypothetical protein [Enterobacter hormaechei]KRT40880.1 hypothetical protein AOX65_01210 [Enterobacter hormaechei]MDE7576015.1 hypothetical protein [Enterobacter hormaechei]
MKTTTQSGQAWRGYERAVLVLIVVLAPQCLAGMAILWGAGRERLRRGETLRFVVSCQMAKAQDRSARR